MAHTSGDWTISNCGDFIEANGELICQGFDKTEENFPNWEDNRGVLVAASDLLAILDLLCKAADNGEWHYSRDCDVEGRHDTCLLCAAIREGHIAIAKAKAKAD